MADAKPHESSDSKPTQPKGMITNEFLRGWMEMLEARQRREMAAYCSFPWFAMPAATAYISTVFYSPPNYTWANLVYFGYSLLGYSIPILVLFPFMVWASQYVFGVWLERLMYLIIFIGVPSTFLYGIYRTFTSGSDVLAAMGFLVVSLFAGVLYTPFFTSIAGAIWRTLGY